MGSGLNKCFLTNQTIPEGIDVIVFPIMPQSDYNDTIAHSRNSPEDHIKVSGPNHSICYANWLYQCQGTYFTCKSDDYGESFVNNTRENKISYIEFLNYLINYSLVTKQGENEYHEQSFDILELLKKNKIKTIKENNKQKITITINEQALSNKQINSIHLELLELGQKNRIITSDYKKKFIKFAICLKSAFDYVNQEFRSQRIQSLMENFPKLASDELKVAKVTKNTIFYKFRLTDIIRHSFDGESVNIGYYVFLYKTMNNLKAKDFKKKINEIKFILDFANFQAGLNALNITIEPISQYQQDYSNEIGSDYLKLIKHANKSVKDFIKNKYN